MWLEEVPSALVNACAVMLPRLEAEESLLASNRVAMGTGRVDATDAARIAADWQRAAADHVTAPRRVDPQQLRAAGFGARRFQKPRKAV